MKKVYKNAFCHIKIKGKWMTKYMKKRIAKIIVPFECIYFNILYNIPTYQVIPLTSTYSNAPFPILQKDFNETKGGEF